MRAYLAAKGEEEKRRQEEEKTRQATLLLDQRRMEHEILQSSLQGGIPPPMVPFVFAGMGGGVLPQAAIEWAHNYLYSQSQQSHTPALLPPGQISASPRRESQAQGYGQSTYAGSAVPSTPGSAQGPPSWYPGSPTRPRGQSMSGPWPPRQPASASQNLPSLDTSFAVRAGGDDRRPAHASASSSAQQQEQTPSIYFHHWQPPPAQSSSRRDSGTDQPGPSPKKRKTSVSRPAPPPLSGGMQMQSATLSNPPPGRRGGHSRQRSDMGTYRPYSGRFDRHEGFGPSAGSSSYASRDVLAEAGPSSSQSQLQSQRSGGHTVSSLLTDDNPSPAQMAYFSPRGASDMPSQPGGTFRRASPAQTSYYTPRTEAAQPGGGGGGTERRGSPDETTRGGAGQTAHERQNND
ncbi:hypothetical protein GE09DRAFT_1211381 [Coniochaeta sp. 2T2.1]|nr:hypothetical protein GE09DRAFT_1211381 [Coniochaeta sp. 2T2.1]